ncbi:LATE EMBRYOGENESIS ABUNDANT (LEA) HYDROXYPROLINE-RICH GLYCOPROTEIN FAMILY [Salix purpurea]|uniref:LATE EMBRYOGENESIS ABUNDANT (LEA) HYDROXYPROLINE-RICH GLYCOPROTEIN FAMILY n=1 Tax=Salix purpurea TaxID=77065 RepID=A0A9Q0VFV5_SALPP|nr:LATE EMBRYOGENESIS ABUNDANT (LEA) HYDROXYPROLINE-RICH GLYCOPROTEIN FAMILY [Salix purpurea]
MADHQKIHPLNMSSTRDVEAPQAPTVPLVPRGSATSDKGDPAAHIHYPPFQRTIPVIHTKPPKKRRSCCCRFFCWTFSLLLLLILVIGLIAGTLYLVFQPKLPKFSIDSLQITTFNLTSNSSLSATFNVTITAKNPNKKVGVYYEGGSHISVWYTGTNLCQGSLPKFYQGHRNTTVLNVLLSGQTDDGSTLITSLQQQQQQTGTIPLNLRVNQPVRIKLGKLKLMKVKFRVRCRLDIDSLSVNNAITIRNSSCKFRFRL